MNHSINFLEPQEVRYLSAAESNPLYKLGAIAAVILIASLISLYVISLNRTVAQGEELSNRWKEIESEVAEAEKQRDERNRLEKGLQTLKGWTSSRSNWNEVMTYIVEQVPGSLENIQFTRFALDETMQGLRRQMPDSSPSDFHPLAREVSINIRGILRSSSPARLLPQFQRNLINGDPPVDFDEVALDRYTQLRDDEGNLSNLTSFAFTIRVSPQEVMP